MNPLSKIDRLLNGVTMYRLVVYGLCVLVAAAFALNVTGTLSLPAKSMAASLAGLLTICYLASKLFTLVWQAPANTESTLITALILFLILPPPTTLNRFLIILLAGLLAVASKYLLALHNKHLFNPAAIAVVIIGLMGLLHATWWVGSSAMLPFTLVLGLLIIRKIRRGYMFAAYLVASLAVNVAIGLHHNRAVFDIIRLAFTSSPLIFLGTVMLTEPSTAPPRRLHQIIYGGLVGGLSISQLHFRSLSTTPEISLVLGNIYSYIYSPKRRWLLRLKSKTQLSLNAYDFCFESSSKLEFEPGQYLEWTLPHKSVDARGNRRTFSIASSPSENVIRLGVKFYQPGSSFKSVLKTLSPGQTLIAGQLAGDFVLPKGKSQKLVFIAGGIGITPFRSMLKQLVDTGARRDIVMFYQASDPAEFSYGDVLKEAANSGLKLVKVLSGPGDKSWTGYRGFLTSEIVKKEVPDFAQRQFYVSGPDAMVRANRSMLIGVGVPRRQIKTDYFPGY